MAVPGDRWIRQNEDENLARKFRFGLQVSNAPSAQAWREKARKAEALGYNVLLMADHFGGQFAIEPALAVAAEATTTLRFGQLVLQNDLRHPAMLAKSVATLDLLSDGRFELGLGAGGPIHRILTGRVSRSIPVRSGLPGWPKRSPSCMVFSRTAPSRTRDSSSRSPNMTPSPNRSRNPVLPCSSGPAGIA